MGRQTQHGVLLRFLDLPLAGAFAQLLFAFERRGRCGAGGSVMVVLLAAAEGRAEQQVTNPGLDEGEGGTVRVSGRHHHLGGQRKINNSAIVCCRDLMCLRLSHQAGVCFSTT